MIKVNLLDSVTDRAKGTAAVVEQKVANPRMQTLLLALVIFGLLTAGMLYDYYSATGARESAQAEKVEQERIQTQMVAVNKERADLERKTADVQVRIDAIQKLRASQQGPGTVLREIKSRFDSVPGLYLKSVEQAGTELTIKGESPNEASVTNFAKSLEFSSGLFTNLSIETQREEVKVEKAESAAPAQPEDKDAPKPEVVAFTIKCTYVPESPAASAAAPAPANQIAQK
ncbi:MAG TPA: PilN domain-containing protein [Pyrinomonadaceae bacterium]|nr:PilN domain-containing protein [Pyrinomonadaceae bacterium]